MNKTMWARPNAKIEEFVANEYVAACFYVGCDVVKTQDGKWYYDDNKLPHAANANKTGCGWDENQVITDVGVTANSDGTYTYTYSLYEKGDRNLPISISNSTYSTSSTTLTYSGTSAGAIIGQTIYWTTSQNGDTYHHFGVVTATDEAHKNAS